MTTTTPPKVIGTRHRYLGAEHPYLLGYEVEVTALLRPSVSQGYLYLTTDEEIAEHGGVTENDRLEVAPIIDGRVSWAASDAKVTDLDAVPSFNPQPQPNKE